METEEQERALLAAGAHLLCQGFLYTRPLPAAELAEWLLGHRLRARSAPR